MQETFIKNKKKACLEAEKANNNEEVGNNKDASPSAPAIAIFLVFLLPLPSFLLLLPLLLSFPVFQPLLLSFSVLPAPLALLSLFVFLFFSFLFNFFFFFFLPTTQFLSPSL